MPTTTPPKRRMPNRKEIDESDYDGRVAVRIRTLRDEAGWSVDDLVLRLSKAGYEASVQTIYGWENGKRATPLNALPYLAKAFRLSLFDFLPSK